MSQLFGTVSDPQPGFDFPQQLTEKYSPRAIADFVGLDKPKKLASKLVAKPFPCALLFIGPSGTGKTTLALAMARAIPAEIHHIPSQECNLETIERVRKTCQYVPMEGCRYHLVLVDEADRMTDAAQVSLLSKLDSTNFPPNTIFVFTANNSDRLEARFLSRLITVEFSSYGIAKDAAALLESIWMQETGSLANAPNFARIVKDANNNVRESIMALQRELLLA